ncbi:putative heparinase superfamily protein [Aliiruegeria haliotis]|uniref:Putative heparinase superfamily protein n=1 Tax=Aliiruegeria haliotis TaxID=1280846 RepID=A0A2T0RT60_9RHOB|nr:heparinase II/III family protein [Aliiruegeria haliotis]PRY24317.1 putative heparinase superfamily protein [Aliiruegeria haliotis]
MEHTEGKPTWQEQRTRFLNRVAARRAARARPATAFLSQPEPRTIGTFSKGRQLLAGNFLFAGFLVEAPDSSPWDIRMPAPRFEEDLHGFRWLDDLAAVGDLPSRRAAQSWTWDWIARYGRGRGAGWTPDLTGRRVIRWINHAIFLLRGQDADASRAFFAALGAQTIFLSRRWHVAASGLPRFEALTGLIYAGLSLAGQETHVAPAVKALCKECNALIDKSGGLPTRNPEELLEVFTLLIWTAQALIDSGRHPDAPLEAAIVRMAPTLRALRHSDGSLARFHGGGRGMEGRLDHALAASGIRPEPHEGLAMGFARMAAGRTTVLVDAAAPPTGEASVNAHASTLAFELTSGRRPIVVNCGPGATFGETWRRAGRATPSHSTLGVDGLSSSRLGVVGLGRGRRGEILHDLPSEVRAQFSANAHLVHLLAGHDGYVATHGLTHVRQLGLARDGRALEGEDTLGALNEADRARFERQLTATQLQGVSFTIRFHLHPDVDATLDMGGYAVSLGLKSGEIWVFRHEGSSRLSLEPSVYLEAGRLKPRATKQIVISGRVVDAACQINWTFAKAQDTPQAIRDIVRDDDEHLSDD